MDILWICPNQEMADKRASIFPYGRVQRYQYERHMIVWSGAALCGRRFDEIILDGWDPYDVGMSKTETARERDWFESVVRCRLVPDGRIRTLKDFSPTLD